MRYKALIEYDGTDYYGFQRQREDQPTIQSALEETVSLLAQEPITITGAGRTDSGVHALGQVVTFDIEWRHGVEALQRAINVNLPVDIAVLQLNESTSTFHPRFDARKRAYKYLIYNEPIRSPIRRTRSWHVNQLLDIPKMNQAAENLLGIHDFATFGRPPQGNNSVREVFSAHWQEQKDWLVFYIEANAFLYRMVRSLVGSLKAVGDGSWSVDDFIDAFRACDRSRAGIIAPPYGLYLVHVAYDD